MDSGFLGPIHENALLIALHQANMKVEQPYEIDVEYIGMDKIILPSGLPR